MTTKALLGELVSRRGKTGDGGEEAANARGALGGRGPCDETCAIPKPAIHQSQMRSNRWEYVAGPQAPSNCIAILTGWPVDMSSGTPANTAAYAVSNPDRVAIVRNESIAPEVRVGLRVASRSAPVSDRCEPAAMPSAVMASV